MPHPIPFPRLPRPQPSRGGGLLPLLLALAVLPGPVCAQQGAIPAALRAQHDSAYFAWDRGDYVAAMRHAERVLTAPGGDLLLERIALLTGELYAVHEITRDGRRAVWSPDGAHAAYESGPQGAPRTHLLATGPGEAREVGSFPGRGAVFSPDGRRLAFLRTGETAELRAIRREAAAAREAGDNARLQRILARTQQLEAAAARVVVREIPTGRETERAPGGLSTLALAYSGRGELVVVGRPAGAADRTELFLLPERGDPRPLTDGPGTKGATLLSAGAERLVYTIGGDGIGVLDLRTGAVRVLSGTAPAVSADGSTLAYLAVAQRPEAALRRGEATTGADVRSGGALNALMVLRLGSPGEPVAVKRTTLPLATPALSPSGRRIAYTTVLRDDWEVFLIGADGSGERRLTREIQHDLFPRFLGESRLLAVMGEARHRRAYLYDLDRDAAREIAAGALPGEDQRGRTRLFDNNTLRTVAPQYEWAPGADGTRVLVVADRDGNTLSPERGVYLVELGRRVTREQVLARVRANLAAERELRERGRRTFAPIEARVRAAVAEVDPARIYDHAHALFHFGSKYYTQPGNALAVEYLASALRAMGYEPELQWFEPRPGVRTANVVATLRGTRDPGRVNVVSSHFDSVERGPGADDNSSGTTALLEAARVLASRPQAETIRFAFLTAEEAGLLGARELVRRAVADGDSIVAALNNDMVGWANNHRLDNTIRYSNDAIRDLQHAAAFLFTDLVTYDARYVLSTDAQAFYDVYGDVLGGIGSYPILGNPHYHQPDDQLEVIDHRLVAEVSKTTVASIMRLASGMEIGRTGTGGSR